MILVLLIWFRFGFSFFLSLVFFGSTLFLSFGGCFAIYKPCAIIRDSLLYRLASFIYISPFSRFDCDFYLFYKFLTIFVHTFDIVTRAMARRGAARRDAANTQRPVVAITVSAIACACSRCCCCLCRWFHPTRRAPSLSHSLFVARAENQRPQLLSTKHKRWLSARRDASQLLSRAWRKAQQLFDGSAAAAAAERERVRESKWLSLVSSANSEPLMYVVRQCASTINKGPNERASSRSPSWPERASDWESGRTVCEIVDTLT